MQIIRTTPNESGAYLAPREWNELTVPDGHVAVTDGLDMTAFFASNGFITPTLTEGVLTSYVTNTEAWNAWKAEEAAKIPPTPEPTIEQRTTALEATQSDVIDILASALGVTI